METTALKTTPNTDVSQGSAAPRSSKQWTVWVGRTLSTLPVLMLLMSATMKLLHRPEVVEMFAGKFGYSEGALLSIGLVELACAALYVIPRTTVLGAILLTGYLGGAIATHVRVSDAFVAPLAL